VLLQGLRAAAKSEGREMESIVSTSGCQGDKFIKKKKMGKAKKRSKRR